LITLVNMNISQENRTLKELHQRIMHEEINFFAHTEPKETKFSLLYHRNLRMDDIL